MEQGWTRAALAAALVVSGAGAAQAATLTVTDTGTLGTGFEVPLSVAAFDPSLGNLTVVAWSLVIDWSAEVTFTNPLNAEVRLNGAFSIDVFNTTDSAGLAGLVGFTPLSQDFLLFNGLAAVSLAPNAEISTSVPTRTYVLSGDTESAIGLGAGVVGDWTGTALTTVTSAANSGTGGIGGLGNQVNLPTRFTQDLTATLSVTYTNNPVTGGGGGPDDPVDPVPVVPLPAGLPLLLGGLAALAVLRRRRGA
ncbi:MAG: VPLPA-CTERM sorting domain-containing protein [Rhodobacteraceae bacterium]|nr:VPLPA-CTERM sorting domain-containing protein [Paracoccaceae bacterium]